MILPYYQDAFVTVYHGDSRDILPQLSGIDMVVTSPPYNVGVEYDEWDDNMNLDDYTAFTDEWLKLCYDSVKDGGRVAVNIPNIGNAADFMGQGSGIVAFIPMVYSSLIKANFTVRECLTWVKSWADEIEDSHESFCGGNTAWGSWKNPSNPFCRSFSEFILVAHKKYPVLQHKGESDITQQDFMLCSRNVWVMPPVNHKKHPATFPEELPRRLIKFYTFLGDTIMDPFLGIGTTAWVAKKYGRKCIGIEIGEKYCEIAANKCRQVVMEIDTGDVVPEPKQPDGVPLWMKV